MKQGLTEEDLERIRRFNEVPAYDRSPELLLPDGDVDEE